MTMELPDAKRRRLNYSKCSYCRKDKKRCQPAERGWPAQKCDRCEKMGLACSESRRATEAGPDIACRVSVQRSLETPQTGPDFQVDLTEDLFLRSQWLNELDVVIKTADARDAPLKRLGSPEPARIHQELNSIRKSTTEKLQGVIGASYTGHSQDQGCGFAASLCLDLLLRPAPPDTPPDTPPEPDITSESSTISPEMINAVFNYGNVATALLLQVRLLRQLIHQTQSDSETAKQHILSAEFARYHSFNAMLGSRGGLSEAGTMGGADLPLLEGNGLLPAAIKYYPKLDATDCLGRSLLHIALYNGVTDGIKRLIDHFAQSRTSLDKQDAFGRTPLLIATEKGQSSPAKLLLDADANPATPCAGGVTALHLAAAKGNTKMVKLLARALEGSDLNYQDAEGQTALHLAAQSARHRAVCVLLSFCVDATVADGGGMTALHHAARGGHLPVVRELLSSGQGASVGVRDAQGRTPLWYAASQGHDDVVVALLVRDEVGADHVDGEGVSPLDVATEQGFTAIAEMMQAGSFLAGPVMMMLYSTASWEM